MNLNNLKDFVSQNKTSTTWVLGWVLMSVVCVYLVVSIFNGNNFLATGISTGQCNVQGINMHGALVSYVPMTNSLYDEEMQEPLVDDVVSSEQVVYLLREAIKNDNIKAIVVEVDSPGGDIVAGEEIYKTISSTDKPVIAMIRSMGASAAYHAISSADYIFASKYSDVGSIGVTMSYIEELDKNKKYINLSAGKYKDAGSAERPLTQEEKDLFMRDVNIAYENLIGDIAANRKMPIDAVRAVADGSTFMGQRALELGFIDALGSWGEVEQYLQTNVLNEKPNICW